MSLHGTRGNNADDRLMPLGSTKGVLDRYFDAFGNAVIHFVGETDLPCLTLPDSLKPHHVDGTVNGSSDLSIYTGWAVGCRSCWMSRVVAIRKHACDSIFGSIPLKCEILLDTL